MEWTVFCNLLIYRGLRILEQKNADFIGLRWQYLPFKDLCSKMFQNLGTRETACLLGFSKILEQKKSFWNKFGTHYEILNCLIINELGAIISVFYYYYYIYIYILYKKREDRRTCFVNPANWSFFLEHVLFDLKLGLRLDEY